MNDSEPVPTRSTADASEHVRAFVQTHGRVPTTILVGGILAALGAIVPFAHANGIFGGPGTSYSMIQSGFYGLVLLIVPIILGIFPISLKRYAGLSLAAFGVACAFLGIFFALWIASSGVISVIGAGAGGVTLGFYLTLFGYAAMVIGYYQLQTTTSGITHA